ncbi:MAG: 23S rRNA (adenine(2503)-C(2))-methyltransferase RlmN [Bacilli bacterium]|jgi:23S rRNA (adenine2503-C2)-methyltransferase
MKENIYNFTRNDLELFLEKAGEKKFRSLQLFDWLYKKKVVSFEEMINIKKESINKFKNLFTFKQIKILKKEEDLKVKKYLLELEDKHQIEAVLMLHDYGNSLCISTQIGCQMGCLFCASGTLKKIRNLEVGEMISQVLEVERDFKERISHIVIMGIGEPFDNYDKVMKFIEIINDHKGLNIGARHITLSTCGIVPGIKKFSQEERQVNLAVSLHASTDELRNKLMPINKVYPLSLLISSLQDYIKITKRRVTFEYILLKEVNDNKEDALNLCKLIKGMNCYVNLIPYNETSHSSLRKSKKMKRDNFYDILKKHNINVTIRKEYGKNISAACGQLRARGFGR